MATERLPTRKSKEILRQKWLLGRPHRQIARALQVGVGTVSAVVSRAEAAALTREQVADLPEPELEGRLYTAVAKRVGAPLPGPASIDVEVRRPGVTLRLLHLEYREAHPDGYGYTQFCDHYRRWKQRQRVVMRQTHRAGEKLFSDHAGKRPHWIDPLTGEVQPAELFVAVLGASNYTYAEATETQSVGDWCGSHTRALEYFGGVPELVVPDQLKAACTRAYLARARSSRHVEAILKSGLDRVPPIVPTPAAAPPGDPHENVRGAAYYERPAPLRKE